jgi:hypothetical protein
MKQLLILITFLVATLSFAQSTGSISGYVLDIESENEPLAYAEVAIKETGNKTFADENGNFKFDDLAEGTYTLVYSFIGYETEELTTSVTPNNLTTLNFHLKATTISLDELIFSIASAEDKASNNTSTN